MTDFLYPLQGPGTWADNGNAITAEGYQNATMAQVVSWFHDIFFKNDEICQQARKQIVRVAAPIWAYTGVLYLPGRGIYIEDLPEIRDGLPVMHESGLVNKLRNNDPNVRFVSPGFQIGYLRPSDLAKNPYIRALAGDEGADQLAEIAGRQLLGSTRYPSIINPPSTLTDLTIPHTSVSSLTSFFRLILMINTVKPSHKHGYSIPVGQ